MKLADVTYLFRWLIIHINIFLITLKFMITLVTCVAFHTIHDYSIFEQKNGSENHLKSRASLKIHTLSIVLFDKEKNYHTSSDYVDNQNHFN